MYDVIVPYAVRGEDYLGPSPSILTFQSSTTSDLDTLCTTVTILDDDNYEGAHFFIAQISALNEAHITLGNDAVIDIIDNGKSLFFVISIKWFSPRVQMEMSP